MQLYHLRASRSPAAAKHHGPSPAAIAESASAVLPRVPGSASVNRLPAAASVCAFRHRAPEHFSEARPLAVPSVFIAQLLADGIASEVRFRAPGTVSASQYLAGGSRSGTLSNWTPSPPASAAAFHFPILPAPLSLYIIHTRTQPNRFRVLVHNDVPRSKLTFCSSRALLSARPRLYRGLHQFWEFGDSSSAIGCPLRW